MLDQASLKQIQEQNAAKRWDKIHSQIHERWPSVPLFDLQAAGGDVERLVGVVEPHTPEDGVIVRREVRKFVASLDDGVSQAGQMISDVRSAFAESAARTRRAVDETVASTPGTALAVTFGAGIVIGSLLSRLLVPAPQPPSTWDRIRPW